jgi:hypothetical protein
MTFVGHYQTFYHYTLKPNSQNGLKQSYVVETCPKDMKAILSFK